MGLLASLWGMVCSVVRFFLLLASLVVLTRLEAKNEEVSV